MDVLMLTKLSEAHVVSLLAGTVVMQQLARYVARMEQQLEGVYASCIRDTLQRQA